MCGIVAYIGEKDAKDVLLDGLKSLEYRGYDSAGIFLPGRGVVKSVGPIENLSKEVLSKTDFNGKSGIAHTRWATHGSPTVLNAHPHSDEFGRVWLVHNGIIENYGELRDKFIDETKLKSKTDTEVLAHLIGRFLEEGESLEEAVSQALLLVRGTFGIAVSDNQNPNKVVVARKGSPMVVGFGEDEYIAASDPSAIVRHTRDVLYLDDNEIAVLEPNKHQVLNINLGKLQKERQKIDWDIESAKKGGHDHFMLKEIMEGPQVLEDSSRGRFRVRDGLIKLGGIESVESELRKIERLVIVGCGSAYYAGQVGAHLIENFSGISTRVEIGSELRYKENIWSPSSGLLAISQSGETADTLAPLMQAKRQGLLTLGIVNTVGSTIARETDAGIYNHAGPEIGVASTKAFISQIEVLTLLALYLGRLKGLSRSKVGSILGCLEKLPQSVDEILKGKEKIKEIVDKYKDYKDFLYIGRKYNFPIAYEGALKLKEVSYVHAEGYGAGEMKHGPIAMIDEDFPTISIMPRDSVYPKMVSNVEEIKARGGKIIAVATEGDKETSDLADDVLWIPKTSEHLIPILSVVPLQLFAYYFGVSLGFDVDKPRNLAKSVTVE